MWNWWRKYLQTHREQVTRSFLPPRPEIEMERDFAVDGRAKGVRINIVAAYGQQWIKIKRVKPFGLASSDWLGTVRSKKKQGLKRQTEKMLRSAEQNSLYGFTPRVIVCFSRGVSRPVAEALRELGAAVEGEIIEPPPPRAERGTK